MEKIVTDHHNVDVEFVEGLGFRFGLCHVRRDVDGLNPWVCLRLLLFLRIRRAGVVIRKGGSYKESVSERQTECQNSQKYADQKSPFTLFLL